MRMFKRYFKVALSKYPIFYGVISSIYRIVFKKSGSEYRFPGTTDYWEKRYAGGGDSGAGSYGRLAKFKADVINNFAKENNIRTVIEFGCGDGNQLSLSKFDCYIGFDVSKTALDICKKRFHGDKNKKFLFTKDYNGEVADMSMSLDVIFHLVEDENYKEYMSTLFSSSNKFVLIYSSNYEERVGSNVPHVRHRKFTDWVGNNACNWRKLKKIENKFPLELNSENESFADFYVFEKM